MESRAGAVGEGEVVHVALAMHPHRPELGFVAVSLGVFGEAKAKLTVEIVARLHVGREAIEMIDALDARALVRAVLLKHGFGVVHLRVKVERHAEDIGGAQRAALVRQVGKRGRQVAAAEPGGGTVDILLARKLEPERAHVGLARTPQDEGVVVALLDAAQVERILGFVAHQKAKAIDIEGARARKIAHAKLNVAGAHDVERRIEDRVADRHDRSPLTVPAPTSNTSRGRRKPAGRCRNGRNDICGLQAIICAAGRASAWWPATASSICARG